MPDVIELSAYQILSAEETYRGHAALDIAVVLTDQKIKYTPVLDACVATVAKIERDKGLNPMGMRERTERVVEETIKQLEGITIKLREKLDNAIAKARAAVPLAGPPYPADPVVQAREREIRETLRAVRDPSLRSTAITEYARQANKLVIPAVLHDDLHGGAAALLKEDEREAILNQWLEASHPDTFARASELTTIHQLFEQNVIAAIGAANGPHLRPDLSNPPHPGGEPI